MSAVRVSPRSYRGKSQEQRRAERRDALLTAALEIWMESGWASVSMRGVCARAGLTDRYFYESFRDRDALLAALWDDNRDRTLGMLTDVITRLADASPLAQLDAAIVAVVHDITDDPARAQILFGDHAGSAVLEQRRRDAVQLTTDLMMQIAKPYLRDDVDDAALRTSVLMGIGGFVELMLAWRSGLIDVDAEAIAAQLMAVGTALATPFLRGQYLAAP